MLDPFVLTLWLVVLHGSIRHVVLLIGLLVAVRPLRTVDRLEAFKTFAATFRQPPHPSPASTYRGSS